MVMIRCPECGHRVLDVATTCPQCHRVLLQNPLETHNWGTLRECGRCHKHIERDAIRCPYCGHRVRAARTAGRIALVTALAVALIAAGVMAWRSGIVGSVREAIAPTRMAPQDTAFATPPTALTEPAPAPAEVMVPPIVAMAPESVATRPGGAAEAPERLRTPGPAVPPPSLVTRWTGDWANVRAGRSVESAIVRVLAPNAEVRVGEMHAGWWAVYANGTFVGYIANSLLRTTPIDS